MQSCCMLPACDATHARHAGDTLLARADAIQGRVTPEKYFSPAPPIARRTS